MSAIQFLQAIANGGNDYGANRGGALLGKYGIPASKWDNYAAAAGIPGASWRDPKAQDMVAAKTVTNLYSTLGDWNLVALAWKYGPTMAMSYKRKYSDSSPTAISSVLGDSRGAWVGTISKRMGLSVASQRPPQSPGPGPGPAPSGGGSIELSFTEEQAEEGVEPEQTRQARPADVALAAILASMADRTAGGRRLDIQDVKTQEVPEGEASPDEITDTTRVETPQATEVTRG